MSKAATAKPRAKARRAKKLKSGEIDRSAPAIVALEQVISTLGAYVTGDIQKRAEACALKATVYFRVVLEKPPVTSGENHGS